MAPATPALSSKSLFAELTIASTAMSVMSPCWITIRSRIDFPGFTRAESHRTLARASATDPPRTRCLELERLEQIFLQEEKPTFSDWMAKNNRKRLVRFCVQGGLPRRAF